MIKVCLVGFNSEQSLSIAFDDHHYLDQLIFNLSRDFISPETGFDKKYFFYMKKSVRQNLARIIRWKIPGNAADNISPTTWQLRTAAAAFH